MFCNDERGHILLDTDQVVSNVEIAFNCHSKKKSFSITFDNDYFERIENVAREMCTWIGTEVVKEDQHKISIHIMLNCREE